MNLMARTPQNKEANMKLGISYNVFDAEELLEPSILAIRDEVAHISVIYQEVSNGNNPCSEGLVALVLDLRKRGLVREGDIIPHDDDVDFYVPIEQRDTLIKTAYRQRIFYSMGESMEST